MTLPTTVNLEILFPGYGHGLQTARQEVLMFSPAIQSSSHPRALPITTDTGIQWTLIPYLVVQLVVPTLKLSIHGKKQVVPTLPLVKLKFPPLFYSGAEVIYIGKGEGEGKWKKRNQISVCTGSTLAQLPHLRAIPSKSIQRCASPKHLVLPSRMLNRQISARMWMNANETLNCSTKWQISNKLYFGPHL